MAHCKECGREINVSDKRCSYCNSRIIQITAEKVFSKTKEHSAAALSKTLETAVGTYDKTSEKLKILQEKQYLKTIEKKKSQVKKLEKKLKYHSE